jgi:hypothetical protein
MIKIKLLKRTFVKKVGVVEAGKTTEAEDLNAIYLVESEHAEYASEAEEKKAAAAKKAS